MERTNAAVNQKRLIRIVSQAFYGNRTGTEIRPEKIDRFVLGDLDSDRPLLEGQKIDRSVIKLPGSDNVVLIYNKYEEEKAIIRKDKYFKIDGYIMKPYAVIPEMGIELFSRCIACRMDPDGTLQSLERDDYDILWKYLAE